MAVEITVPMLGDGMRDGVIAEWYAPDGAEVQCGQPLYRLESNFVAVDIEAEYSGVLEHRLEAGGAHQPGSVAALIAVHPGQRTIDGPATEAAVDRATAGWAGAEDESRPAESSSAAAGEEAPAANPEWSSAMAGWAHVGAAERGAAQSVADAPLVPASAEGEFPADVPEAVRTLPGLRRGTLHAEPPPANSAWDAVEGDQEFDAGWQKPVEPATDMFGFVLDKDDESEERVSGVLGFSLGQHRRRLLPEEASAPVGAREALAAPVALATAVEEVPGEEEDEDDALPYAPEPVEAATEQHQEASDHGGAAEVPAMDWDLFEAPLKDPAEPVDGAPDGDGDRQPAPPPIPFPVRAVDQFPAAVETAPLPAAVMVLRVTAQMAEVRKMQAQLGREWQQSGAAPGDEDIALRALARATTESPALRGLGDTVGLVLLEPEGESIVVLEGAAHGPFRERVARLAQLKYRRERGDCRPP